MQRVKSMHVKVCGVLSAVMSRTSSALCRMPALTWQFTRYEYTIVQITLSTFIRWQFGPMVVALIMSNELLYMKPN